ncbi:MAG: DNA-directed RNA polymerase subunit H [Nanoarchaeota archaeon]|nr:DNA-directed RNA polymerase subunit H [Nanoarchaeota archaeon]MBU1321330.1 DNA-directed RNA polymerase subunit H [Nanoarchaeota archaeon]MBU1597537.1 DNA-directed RNA polymerase subunit H [Nanoarchaeota archaeon]MBU2441122.1 DNA-directed RNA polymerase subunit H [Nanoarchaeota archaeon]
MSARTAQIKHELIPEHIKLSDNDVKDLFKKYNITLKELPKIFITDPAIVHMSVKEGDVIQVKRESLTAGEISYYRGVIKE